MRIESVEDLHEALEQGPYTSIGSYPIFFITADGAALAYKTVKDELELIEEAIRDNDSSGGWRVVAADVNWEDPELYDDHTSERIESAYAEENGNDE